MYTVLIRNFMVKGSKRNVMGTVKRVFFFKMRKVTRSCNNNQVERKIIDARKKKEKC